MVQHPGPDVSETVGGRERESDLVAFSIEIIVETIGMDEFAQGKTGGRRGWD